MRKQKVLVLNFWLFDSCDPLTLSDFHLPFERIACVESKKNGYAFRHGCSQGLRFGSCYAGFWFEAHALSMYIDLVNNCIRVIPEKNSNPRNLPISNKLVSMLNAMPQNTQCAFTYNTDAWIRNYSRQRKKIAFKLKDPRLMQIHFHTFRHWKATTEYHKTQEEKDRQLRL